MPPAKLLVLLLMLVTLNGQAQNGETFTVKKPAAKTIAGYYCSDAGTDGRLCFHFDSAGQAQAMVTGQNVADIALQFLNAKADNSLGLYAQSGDTIKLFINQGISGTGFEKAYKGKMSTVITALVKGTEMAMTITAIIEGMQPTVKNITLYKVKQ